MNQPFLLPIAVFRHYFGYAGFTKVSAAKRSLTAIFFGIISTVSPQGDR
jgi:hypothetical protein